MKTKAVLVAAVAATLAISGTASAAPPVHETFHEDISDTDDDFCGTGLSIDVEGVVNGRGLIRARGQEGLIYFAEHVVVEFTYTNLVSGASITTVERSLSKDLKVVDNGGGTLTV